MYEPCEEPPDAGVKHPVNYRGQNGWSPAGTVRYYERVKTTEARHLFTADHGLTLWITVAFILGDCLSDANVQAIGTREQDEAQTPCCYPHLPDGVCVRYVRAFTTRRGVVPSRWHRRCSTAFLISATVARSSHPPISDRLTVRRGRARHYSYCSSRTTHDAIRAAQTTTTKTTDRQYDASRKPGDARL